MALSAASSGCGASRTAIDQQQVVAVVAALGMKRVAELGFVAAAQGVQVVEQDRDGQSRTGGGVTALLSCGKRGRRSERIVGGAFHR